MRFERLWSTGRTVFDWPLEFSLNICVFFREGAAGAQHRLASRTDSQTPRPFAFPSCFFKKSSWLIWGTLHRTVVRLRSPRHAPELSAFRTEGMVPVRSFRSDRRLISPIGAVPRCVTLCGEADRCLLWVFVEPPAARGATPSTGSHGNPEEWQVTFARPNREGAGGGGERKEKAKKKKLRINFQTEARKFFCF